jgi:biopolymer transport protein TolR
MKRFSSHKSARIVADINVVPFIDVMLVLLVIFMITTPLLSNGVKVELPQTAANNLPVYSNPIIVTVDRSGDYYVNTAPDPGHALSATELQSVISAQLAATNAQQQPKPVLVRGDSSTSYGIITAAMVLLKKAGANTIGLLTQATN